MFCAEHPARTKYGSKRMKLVFYSVVLNHHQAPVADAFRELLGEGYTFVETTPMADNKGGAEDFSKRPYLVRAWESEEAYAKAMELARTADCCVFSGVQALPFQKERMRLGLLSFDMSERWLKRGLANLFSPAVFKMFLAYKTGGWGRKPLYKLCCSAFAAADQNRVATYRGKCYKWGYFTRVGENDVETSSDVSTSNITPLMWCSRYLMLKHPELPILMAADLKKRGYKFRLDMYGDGEYRPATEHLVSSLGLGEEVAIRGNVSNAEVRAAMAKSDIFLFTSDRNEGWGAVSNESLSCGCALVASDGIGSTPYLVEDGADGCMFRSPGTATTFGKPDRAALADLTDKVARLLDDKEKLREMKANAAERMQRLWSPRHAAESLLQLIDDLGNGRDTSIQEGPCSKA